MTEVPMTTSLAVRARLLLSWRDVRSRGTIGQETTVASSIVDDVTGTKTIEQTVLALVDGFVSELGSMPVRGRVELDDVLDRDLGIGSLERVELLARLEDAFATRFADSVLGEVDSIRDLVAAVIAGGATTTSAAVESAVPIAAGVAAPDSARTLIDVLRWHAEADPDRVHLVLRLDDGSEQRITYGELWARASTVAGGLRARGIERRRRRRAHAAHGARRSSARSSACCSPAPFRCRSTRRSGPIGSRSTRRARSASSTTPRRGCS